MRTSKWSICESASNLGKWSIEGNTVGRKSTKRKRNKRQWSIGGTESSKQSKWSICG